jgi:hypothetical protein
VTLSKRQYDSPVIDQVAELLRAIGPFAEGAPRKDKWRTVEQLAYLLVGCYGNKVNIDDLDLLLCDYEKMYRERMKRGLPPAAKIRRAVYPDQTTALSLWGSTEYHGQPWPKQPVAERADPPGDFPARLHLPEEAPRVFLSHAHRDVQLALRLVEALATRGIGAWMYETDIAYRDNIAECVRLAIKNAACCVALATRDSIASLWLLTELHTAVKLGRPVALVIDSADALLLDLLRLLKFNNPEADFDHSVDFRSGILDSLGADYSKCESSTRAARYQKQARDFLITLPLYLDHLNRPAFAFPECPAEWAGPIRLATVDDLADTVLRAHRTSQLPA